MKHDKKLLQEELNKMVKLAEISSELDEVGNPIKAIKKKVDKARWKYDTGKYRQHDANKDGGPEDLWTARSHGFKAYRPLTKNQHDNEVSDETKAKIASNKWKKKKPNVKPSNAPSIPRRKG